MPPSIDARYVLVPGNTLTVDIHGADGTRLRVQGRLDSAPDGYGNVKTRIVIEEAVARVLDEG